MNTFSRSNETVALVNRSAKFEEHTTLRRDFLDPIAADEPDDPLTTLTDRQLVRLILLSAETGVRFQREGIAHDPAAWMMTPRRLFRGETALTACREQDNFVRAIILHGLSIGLDADPFAIDELMTDAHAPHCSADAPVIANPVPGAGKCSRAKSRALQTEPIA